MKNIRIIEILLAEVAIYLILWLTYDYLATILSLIFCAVCFLILIVSLIVEWVERSKVPRWYFSFLAVSTLAPILAALIFIAINGGELPWLKE